MSQDTSHDLEGKHIVIMGKGMTGDLCDWQADEVWGVNNVASQEKVCQECEPKLMAGEADPECPVCNKTRRVLAYPGKKWDKLFAFDTLPQEYTDEMKKYAPVCSWRDYASFPYPKDEVIAQFGTRYFTNTISYMVAYAIYSKVRKISMYGVEMSFGAPYAQENRGVEYWLGRAQQSGIEVFLPEGSGVLRTVYKNLYGEVNDCNMLLYLHERLNIINILPKKGHYGESLKAQNAWWVLFPKEDEAKAHNVKVIRDPQGNLSFQAPKEFTSDVQMPPEVWEYLRNILIEKEKAGELDFGLTSVYEKLVLSKEATK
jgi:hypothetical protein